jgi:predicted Zn-dependent protease
MSEPDLAPIAAAVQSGDWPAAERLAGEQLDAFPRHEKLLALRAMSLQVQGRLDDAIEAYGELTAAHPGSSAHWNNQASVLYQAGDRVRAAAACAEAIRRDPRNPWPHLTLGLVRLDARDPAGARASLLDAFERAPQAARIRIHAARACSLCQDFQGVEDLLRPWRDWLPLGDAALQVELANLLLATGDAVSARMLLEEIVRERPDDHAAALFLAHVEERFNELDAAERRVEGVLAVVEPGAAARVEALQLQALLALRRGDARAAWMRMRAASGARSKASSRLVRAPARSRASRRTSPSVRCGHGLRGSRRMASAQAAAARTRSPAWYSTLAWLFQCALLPGWSAVRWP